MDKIIGYLEFKSIFLDWASEPKCNKETFGFLRMAANRVDIRDGRLKYLTKEISCLTKNGSTIRVLDHGCGKGMLIIFLLLRFRVKPYGIDVNHNLIEWFEALNDKCVVYFGYKPFTHYDGRSIPHGDGCFDVAYSHQVVEHLSPTDFVCYFSEESRVLSRYGTAVHIYPTKLSYYDSHLKSVGVHWFLPKRYYMNLLAFLGGIKGGDQFDQLEKGLWLRFPLQIRNEIKRRGFLVEDLSLAHISDRIEDIASSRLGGSKSWLGRKFGQVVRYFPPLGWFAANKVIILRRKN